MKKLYLIGSLRNEKVSDVANQIEAELDDWQVFDEWLSAGPEADDKWRDHQTKRGRSYIEALKGPAAKNVFNFDKKHLDEADATVLLAPAGKSGHLELGYSIGRGKPSYYLLDDPERWDVMLRFCTGVFVEVEELVKALKKLNFVKMIYPVPSLFNPAPFNPKPSISTNQRSNN